MYFSMVKFSDQTDVQNTLIEIMQLKCINVENIMFIALHFMVFVACTNTVMDLCRV